MKLAWSFNSSFNELSMISEVFHDSWLIFQWSLWSPWSPKLFETVQNSLSAVFKENGLSAVFQRSLNVLSKVLLVFPWSFDSLCYLVLSESVQQSRSVFQRQLSGVLVSLSEFFQWSRSVYQRSWLIFQRSLAVCQMIFQWSLNSLIGLSVHFQLSSRSYGDLAGKVVFGLSMVFQGFSEPFHRDSKFHLSWRLLKDLANFSVFQTYDSRVSVLGPWSKNQANRVRVCVCVCGWVFMAMQWFGLGEHLCGSTRKTTLLILGFFTALANMSMLILCKYFRAFTSNDSIHFKA